MDMTQLNEKDKAAQMADMRSFDEPMQSVGSFSFDSGKKVLLNVCKKEITPKMIEDARAKGVQVIECPTRFESHSLPSGRIIWNTDKFEILVGFWPNPFRLSYQNCWSRNFRSRTSSSFTMNIGISATAGVAIRASLKA